MRNYIRTLKFFTLVLCMLLTLLAKAANRYSVANGNWNSTATWAATSGGAPGASIPVAADVVFIERDFNVTIPGGFNAFCTTMNITFTTGFTGTLTFSAAAVLTVSGNITVGGAGSTSREGTINMTAGGTLNCNGNLTIGNNGLTTPIASEIDQGIGSVINVAGNVSILASATDGFTNQWAVNAGTATVTGTLSLANTANANRDCNFSISTGTATLNGAVTMAGATTENSIAITGAGTLNLGNSISAANGTFSPGAGSTVNYSGAAQTIRAATYQNLRLSGSGNKTIPLATTVNVIFSMRGTAAAITNAPTFGVTSTLEYAGSVAQTATNIDFPAVNGPSNLLINNSSGVALHAARSINGNLILTNGILSTTVANLLTVTGTSAGAGGSATSHVNGPVAKFGSTSYQFPIGNGTIYRPISISGLSASATVTGRYTQGNPKTTFGTALGTGINHIGICEYWDLDDGTASITGIVGLQFGGSCNSSPYINDPASLLVAHWNGAQWQSLGNDGTATLTSVKANTTSTFSPFTVGSSSILNPLPVTFSNVKAFEKGSGVQLEWSNLTEKDLVTYVIERSANGRDFTTLSQLAPRSNQNDMQSYISFDSSPLNGTNFYRIKTVEIDGKITYSKLLKVDIGRIVKGILLYPNPVTASGISIGFTAAKGRYTLHIINNAGQEVYVKQLVHPGGTVSQSIELPSALKTGVYNLMISGDNYKEYKMFILQ